MSFIFATAVSATLNYLVMKFFNSKNNMKYSIIIPCYNEYNNLLVLLDKIKIILDQNKNLQIVIVNNGSTDDTSNLLKSINCKI